LFVLCNAKFLSGVLCSTRLLFWALGLGASTTEGRVDVVPAASPDEKEAACFKKDPVAVNNVVVTVNVEVVSVTAASAGTVFSAVEVKTCAEDTRRVAEVTLVDRL